MAELSSASLAWTSRQMRAQWAAVAWLRWRMLLNSFRRRGHRFELIGSVFLYLFLAGAMALPVLGAGFLGFYLAQSGHLDRLSWLLWGIFLLAQFANINLGQPGTTFDPNQLIRFPLPLRQFVLLRLFFGMLSPSNVLVVLMGCATAIGLSAALPQHWLAITLALLVFAIVNVLFSRMLFAWVDRWLSTRRARELFTGLIFIGSLGAQYLNVQFNVGSSRYHRHDEAAQRWNRAQAFYTRAQPVLQVLPPELTARSVQGVQTGPWLLSLGLTAGCAAYGLLFLTIFARRMRTEFYGEALSDEAFGGSAAAHTSHGATLTRSVPDSATPAGNTLRRFGLFSRVSDPVRVILFKEFLYTRRNVGVFYNLIAPLAMVFLFAGRMATRNSTPWIFPAALAYALIGVMPLSFNSFGLEGTGSQLYFLAPLRLRDVLFAKNLAGFGLAALEAVATVIVVTVLMGIPNTVQLVSTLLWAAATLLVGTTLGNFRSLSAPKQIKLSKLSGKQASPLSALMSLAILLLSAGMGACVLIIARSFHLAWLPPLAFAAMFGGALVLYVTGLRNVDRYALAHREEFFEELCKS